MTTNNLIGYDPLAWMEGEEAVEEVPAAPVKKVTKSRAKVKAAPVEEVIEETAIETVEETPEELPVAEIVEDEDVEIDVSIDENGEIEITVDTDKNVDVEIEVEIEKVETAETEDVLDTLVEEVTDISEAEDKPEIAEESVPEVEEMPEEIATVEPLIELGTEASLKTIAELYEHCKRVLAAHDVIEINASDIAMIDTATLQLLVSLKKDAPLLGKTINIICPSARFIESAKLLDLLTILDVTE